MVFFNVHPELGLAINVSHQNPHWIEPPLMVPHVIQLIIEVLYSSQSIHMWSKIKEDRYSLIICWGISFACTSLCQWFNCALTFRSSQRCIEHELHRKLFHIASSNTFWSELPLDTWSMFTWYCKRQWLELEDRPSKVGHSEQIDSSACISIGHC